MVLHHVNFVRDDNAPTNLQPMRKIDHDVMHAAMRDRAHFNTPEFHERRIAAIKEFWVGARQDGEFMQRRRRTASTNISAYMRERPDHFREAVRENGRRGKAHLTRFNTSRRAKWNNRARAGFKSPCPLCDTKMIATSSLHHHAKKEHPNELNAGRAARRRGENLAECLARVSNNHKVVSVDAIADSEDVFCLTVPGLNNFALADGVFVHNCGNMAIRLDTPYSAILHRVAEITLTSRKSFPSASAEPTTGVSRTSCLTTPRPGWNLTWANTARKRWRSLAQSDPAITTSISCMTRRVTSGSASISAAEALAIPVPRVI